MIYNISYEVAGILLMLIIGSAIRFNYVANQEANRRYVRFVRTLTLAEIMDVASAITLSYPAVFPSKLNYFLVSVYFLLSAFCEYYVVEYFDISVKKKTLVNSLFNRIVLAIYVVLILTNAGTGWVFTMYNNVYGHGILYMIVYIVPFYFIANSAWLIVRGWSFFNAKQRISNMAYIIVSTVFCILQLVFFQRVLLTFFGASLCALLILFSLETPDYAELEQIRRGLVRKVEEQSELLGEREKRITDLSLETVTALAHTVDAKDRYTNEHSTRVAYYSRLISQMLGMEEEDQINVYNAAQLHDIGKIFVPDEIINKTGGLTDDEFYIIQQHTTIGYAILNDIKSLPDIANGARWHHERFDGQGYPDHLKGENIPLMARIICVADTYDAMTSRRSYRDALPIETVIAEIERGKGSQFDPVIADKMIEIIRKGLLYENCFDSGFDRG